MSRLKIAHRFGLPLEAVTQTFAILAKRGAGKSYTASVMVEEMLDAGTLPIVLDPLGVWWGLRSSADGKSEGYPITVLGGDHGDVPLESTAGETVADFVVRERQPVILDLSHFRKGEQTRFVTAFAERLYQKNREPIHLIVDEADSFAPQRPQKGQERMLGAMEDLARRGRARGIGMTLVTQRSAVLNKNVLTQIECLIVMRTTSPQDRAAMKAWVDVHGEEETWREMNEQLPKLPIGTAYLWSPGWLDEFRIIEVRERRTFDSSATPKVGEKRIEPRKLAPVDLDQLSEQMAQTIEKAKQDDPRHLRGEIAQLRKQLAERPEIEPEVEIREVAVFPEPLKVAVRKALDHAATAVENAAQEVRESAQHHIDNLDQNFDLGIEIQEAPPLPSEKSTPPKPGKKSQRQLEELPEGGAAPDSSFQLRAGARRMLELLARMHPLRLTRSQLATMSGMAPKGGTFNTYYGVLRRNGLMVENGSGRSAEVGITQSGFDFLGTDVPRSPLTTEERLDLWRSSLRAGARTMLDTLVDYHPRSITRQELAEACEMTASGGTFNTYLGTLRRNGLAEVDGQEVRAGEALFVGA